MFRVAKVCAEFLRILLFITRPWSDHVLTFLYELFMGKTAPLPPIKPPILLMSSKKLAEKIRNRQLKSEDVVQAYVERCREIHAYINAVVDERYEDALDDAKAVDRFLDSREKSIEEIAKDTPLLGVPFSVKEAIGVKGMAQTCGIVKCKGRVAEEDSDSVTLFKKAGAIPVTVTLNCELLLWWESTNLIHGMPKNPYNHVRTSGGSTGGEAALLTSAGAVIGIGNDLGGSIRMPSSFCGIYGHKPTSGLVSNRGLFPESDNEVENDMECTGPMCRYAEDLPLLMSILLKDKKKINFNNKIDFRKVKIYYMETFPGTLSSSTPPIKEAVRSAARYFEQEYGTKSIKLEFEELRDAMSVWECKFRESGVPSLKEIFSEDPEFVNMWFELLKCLFGRSEHTLPLIYFGLVERTEKDEFYEDCIRKHNSLEEKINKIFEEDAVMLLPVHPEVAPHILMTIPKLPNTGYTSIMSTLGLSATAIPAGMSMGVPFGIQAVSGKNMDNLTIAAALELDKLFGGWKSPCPIDV